MLIREKVEWCRYDQQRKELAIRFCSGWTLFIGHIEDLQDISVTQKNDTKCLIIRIIF